MIDLVPPPELVDAVGAGDFTLIGESYLQHFVTLAGLQPDHCVLDVGCGVGRMAVPLTHYLAPPGEYEGFDIVPEGVAWCQENIAARYPHFRFQLAAVYNRHYNPGGTCRASEYRFPYRSRSFDLVFLVSVLTHMLPADMERYLAETTRVLKRNGRCLITFFLLNPESRALMRAGCSNMDFGQWEGVAHVADRANPEAAVAYEQGYVERLFRRHGLEIGSGLHLGAWSGRPACADWQDMVVARRKPRCLVQGKHAVEVLRAAAIREWRLGYLSLVRESGRLVPRAARALRGGGPRQLAAGVRDYLRWRGETRRPKA